MFTTFRSQILFFITIVILITAATIMYFTYRDVGRAMMNSEQASIKNISHFIQLNIKNEYDQLLYSKVDAIRRLKKELRALTSLSIAMHQVQTAGKLAELEQNSGKPGTADDQSRTRAKEIQAMAGQWFNSPLLDREIDWLMYDGEGQAMLSSSRSLDQVNTLSFLDMKGRPLKQKLSPALLSSKGEFAVFRLATGRQNNSGQSDSMDKTTANNWKLGFFMPLKKWHVSLATIIDISDLVKMEKKNIQRIIDNMRLDFATLKIAESGFVFVFDGKKKMLIPPPSAGVTRFFSTKINPETRQTYLDDFMAAGRQENNILYLPSIVMGSPGSAKDKYAVYTTWFRGFDWYTVIVLPVDEIRQPATRLVTRQSYIIGCIFLVSLIFCYLLVSRISRPLQLLTRQIKGVSGLDFAATDNPALNSLIRELPVASNNEAGRLARGFGFMVTELQANIRKLIKTTASNERMESELNVARDIQMGTLPTVFHFEPERKELDIHACLIPARETGGDLYDFFFIDEDHLCFTLGDVADKGVPAALFMVITKVLVKISAQGNPSPAEMMERINEILCQDNPNGMFVTLIIGILNVRTGELRYANGGHNPPIFSNIGQGSYYKKELSGPMAGAMPAMEFTEISMTLEPGQAMFLYTDGVTEAMNEAEELFSDERLLSEFALVEDQPCATVIDRILDRVKTHAGSAAQSDDIAMMMIRLNRENINTNGGD
jgi:sigma-B regulation protein RsbU (phosphoserine phosphatase)